MSLQIPAPGAVPILKGRLLGTLLLSIAFVASIALGVADRRVLIPLYMLASVLFVTIFNGVQGSRLNAYMKAHFPEEYWKWVPRDDEHGYNSLRGLRFAFSGGADDAPALARLRRCARRGWIESMLILPYMMLVILVGAALSE